MTYFQHHHSLLSLFPWLMPGCSTRWPRRRREATPVPSPNGGAAAQREQQGWRPAPRGSKRRHQEWRGSAARRGDGAARAARRDDGVAASSRGIFLFFSFVF
ncbi:hypothetical protein PVAP13_8NG224401 [Panicum virgatum]|uniref:Uncharacterized protein n=1 Tax=Panicum virgatum TaxID=38727 RepID=A0A8T0PHK4_PANVG|nr:hypothetical protein PVAP13_8NG224401 [Panicum virgatum]